MLFWNIMWKHNTNILLYTSAKLHLHDKVEKFNFLENLIVKKKKNYKFTLLPNEIYIYKPQDIP